MFPRRDSGWFGALEKSERGHLPFCILRLVGVPVQQEVEFVKKSARFADRSDSPIEVRCESFRVVPKAHSDIVAVANGDVANHLSR